MNSEENRCIIRIGNPLQKLNIKHLQKETIFTKYESNKKCAQSKNLDDDIK